VDNFGRKDVSNELINQMRAEVLAQHIVLLALIQTHPDRARLAGAVDRNRQEMIDQHLGLPISDELISLAEEAIQRYRMLILP
jgi:hypothetical protein